MYDVEVEPAWFTRSMPIINMKNVQIRRGDWKHLILGGGQWENVQISPNVHVDNKKTTLGDVRVRNVTFPEGPPWKGGELTLVESDTPFDWPEIIIPTPEELGLVK